jgi:transposase
VKKNNPNEAIIIVLDNLEGHKGENVKADAKRFVIKLVFLPPHSLDLNPIKYIWKSTKKVISTTFGRHMDDMRNI